MSVNIFQSYIISFKTSENAKFFSTVELRVKDFCNFEQFCINKFLYLTTYPALNILFKPFFLSPARIEKNGRLIRATRTQRYTNCLGSLRVSTQLLHCYYMCCNGRLKVPCELTYYDRNIWSCMGSIIHQTCKTFLYEINTLAILSYSLLQLRPFLYLFATDEGGSLS